MEGVDLISGTHAEGLRLMQLGLSQDEGRNEEEALSHYRQAQAVLNIGLEVRCDLPHCVGTQWTHARKLQQAMRKCGMQNRSRIKDLETKLEVTDKSTKLDLNDQNRHRDSPPPPYTEKEEAGAARPARPAPPPPYTRFPQTDNQSVKPSFPTENVILPSEECDTFRNPPTVMDDCCIEVTKEIFRIDQGVRLFFVNSDGQVTGNPGKEKVALVIYRLPAPRDSEELFHDSNNVHHILQVDDWIYPLGPLSMILKSGEATFMFPDSKGVKDVTDGGRCDMSNAVGVILDKTVVPLDVRFVFEERLRKLALLLTEEEAASLDRLHQIPDTVQVDGASASSVSHHRVQPKGALAADFVARGMLSGATAMSKGLVRGAQFAGTGIKRGSEKIREKIQPVAAPIAVDPKVKIGLKVVKKGSEAAVVAGGYVLEKLGDATMFVGRKMAPVVKTQANKYLPDKYKMGDGEGSGAEDSGVLVSRKETATDKALTLLSGGLEGLVTIYQGLEASGRILASSIADESVKIVDLRYGTEVAEAATSGLEAIGNIGYCGYLSGSFGAKALAKRVAKTTGRAILEDYSVKKTQPHFYEDFIENSSGDVKAEDLVGKPINLRALDEIHEKRIETMLKQEVAGGREEVEDLEDGQTLNLPHTQEAKLQLLDDAMSISDDVGVRPKSHGQVGASKEDNFEPTDRKKKTCLETEY